MDVIEVWNGRYACTLQAALRMTNEAFAAHLGVAVRTIAAWHADPDVVPRTEMQQLLDTTYENASDPVRQRFALLAAGGTRSSPEVPTEGPAAQALRVAIAIVIRDADVLLVCRRGDDAGGITWQFPAGVVKPGVPPELVTVQETHSETNVHCAVRQHLGSRLHPITGVLCEYFLCEYLAGDARNSDVVENVDVTWAPKNAITRFIPADRIYPPIMAVLEEQA
ncbi:NUDIX domain-containing protein [Streptomyces sp. NPDC051940]|uniref:NUDIX hydrolase n=1 Tax=Streptomyces sp. NPDC051940 TaxID=3155675 RepID=UPI003435FF4A